jgi:hypothetical protein
MSVSVGPKKNCVETPIEDSSTWHICKELNQVPNPDLFYLGQYQTLHIGRIMFLHENFF